MTDRERQLKRRIQIIVASAMVIFFSLVLTLTVQLAIRGNQRAMEKQLMATQIQLQQQLKDEEILKLYYLSQKYVDEIALKELGYGRNGAKIFNRK